jgi:hypothetical protein
LFDSLIWKYVCNVMNTKRNFQAIIKLCYYLTMLNKHNTLLNYFRTKQKKTHSGRQCDSLVLMAFPWHCTDLSAHTVVLQEWSALTILETILCFKTIILNSSSAFLFNISRLSHCLRLDFKIREKASLFVWKYV